MQRIIGPALQVIVHEPEAAVGTRVTMHEPFVVPGMTLAFVHGADQVVEMAQSESREAALPRGECFLTPVFCLW